MPPPPCLIFPLTVSCHGLAAARAAPNHRMQSLIKIKLVVYKFKLNYARMVHNL